jgi:hypothetical protein
LVLIRIDVVPAVYARVNDWPSVFAQQAARLTCVPFGALPVSLIHIIQRSALRGAVHSLAFEQYLTNLQPPHIKEPSFEHIQTFSGITKASSNMTSRARAFCHWVFDSCGSRSARILRVFENITIVSFANNLLHLYKSHARDEATLAAIQMYTLKMEGKLLSRVPLLLLFF